jgi:type II pantothenate kinase
MVVSGLVRLLTSCSTFDEVIRLTESGSSANVDMLVGDIYGGDCAAIGLRSDVIAASFGKVSMQREEERYNGPMFFFLYIAALIRHYEEGFWLILLTLLNSIPGVKHVASRVIRWGEARAASVAMCGSFRAHDVAIALLRMVSNNIGHIACMCAQQRKLPHIIFGGSFIRDHPYTIATISSGVSSRIPQPTPPSLNAPQPQCPPASMPPASWPPASMAPPS